MRRTSWLSFLCRASLTTAILLVARVSSAVPEYGVLFPSPDESVLRLLAQDDIAHPNSYWVSFNAGGTFYDARRDTLAPRYSTGVQAGRRFGRFGVFLNLEIDRSVDLTQETKVLDVIHIGPGIESLFLYGRTRASVSSGLAILNTDTDFDSRGKIGWYIDLRPLAFRWSPFGNQGVVELSPLTVDLSIPVTQGIPLILFSYFTVLTYEWGGINP